MKHATLVLALLSIPASASADIGFDNVFLGYENTEISGSGGDLSGDTLVIKRELSPLRSFVLSGEYSNTRFQQNVDQQTAILQGLLYVPDETFTLAFGAGWLVTEIDAGNLEAEDDGPILSLESRIKFSEKLGLLLGIDHIELHEAANTNIFRASLLMSDGEAPVDIVFTYEVSDTADTSDNPQTYGLGLRCNF